MMGFPMEKVLLDSTYLLPIVGVSIKGVERALSVLEKLYRSGEVEVYYSPFSLLEIIWKLSKMKYDEKIVGVGLSSIAENFQSAEPKPQSYLEALSLRS